MFLGYKKVVFHCGIHKTGSSFLQDFLARNRDVLRELSIEFPAFRGGMEKVHNGNHSVLAMTLPEEGISNHFQKSLDIRNEGDTLLISGEEFSRYLPQKDRLQKLKSELSSTEVSFIFYFRRFDILYESVYAESVKHSLTGDITNTKFQLDFFETIRPFLEVFGSENIVVRPYNKSLWKDTSLDRDFLKSIDIPDVDLNRFSFENKTVNQSFSRAEIFLLSNIEDRPTKRDLISFFENKPLMVPNRDIKYFRSPTEREIFNRNHCGSFEKVCKIFNISNPSDFLDLYSFPDKESWQQFTPNWNIFYRYMSSYSEFLHQSPETNSA